MRFACKTVLAIFLLAAAYLGLVAVWASASFHAVMEAAPAPPTMPLSARQTAILLRVEDPTFFKHPGVSLAEGQGVATISSAVARDLYLSDRPLAGVSGVLQRFYGRVFDCCKKVDPGRDVMALVLNAKLPKRNQLALYVADVYMGSHDGKRVTGLAMAADTYLGKPLDEASEAEFIGLVAMIKAPNHYHPLLHPEQLAVRVARIQALLDGKCQPDGWFDTDYDACAQ
ncbi:Transglycosylase [Duganella sp. CF517]|nr:Transglycosylase [Duganella sp. CF517]